MKYCKTPKIKITLNLDDTIPSPSKKLRVSFDAKVGSELKLVNFDLITKNNANKTQIKYLSSLDSQKPVLDIKKT